MSWDPILKKQQHRFSQQRLWGGVGFGAATLLVGYIKGEFSINYVLFLTGVKQKYDSANCNTLNFIGIHWITV